MPRQRATDLTERERDLLQRVLRHETSKEIARSTGLSERQVNRALDNARLKLGASDRTKAALLLEQLERGQRSPGEPLPLPVQTRTQDVNGTAAVLPPHVEEAYQPFLHEAVQQLPELPKDQTHDLTKLLTTALKFALFILAGTILAIVVLRTLSEVGRPHPLFFSP